MDRNQQFLIGILSLVWLLIAFTGYIYIHKPFSIAEISGIALMIWRTLIAITLISIAGGIGLLTNLRNLDLHPFALAMLTAAFGCGIMSVGVLLIGSTIGVNLFLWGILFVITILLRKRILFWWKYWQPVGTYWQKTSAFGKIIILLTIIIVTCEYASALAPPLQFDALTYHLAIPKAYLQIGHIVYLPENIFWGMPQQTEMLYTLSMLIGGDEAAAALGWWLGILTLAGLIGFAEKIFDRDAAWVAVASLMCASGLTTSISSGYVEWATILLGLSMAICLNQWLHNKQYSTLILAGAFAGMAIGIKYTAGIALLAGLMIITLIPRPYSLKKAMINLLLFGGMASLCTLPWLIKNIIATSNPFYPLLAEAGAMDAIRLAQYQAKPLTQDWSRLLLLPFQATVWGIDGGVGFSTSIGPLLLGLSLLTFINWNEKTEEQRLNIKISGGILITGLLIWATASQFSEKLIQTRLYFVIFPIWALLCVSGYLSISKVKIPNVRFGNIVAAFIIMALGFNTFSSVINVFRSSAALAAINPELRKQYLEKNLGVYALTMQQVNALPKDAHVMMLWETRGFECMSKCDSDEVIDEWFHQWALYNDPQKIINTWKEKGYTHILINRLGADFIREEENHDPKIWIGLNKTLNSLILVNKIGESYEIYALP